MSNIFQFIPKAQAASLQNLDEFIVMCRDRLTVFSADLDWYSHAWPGVGNFTKKGAPSRGYSEAQLLDAGIIPFAKAYVRYQQGHNPNKLKNEFKAIRCVEAALLEIKGCADITQTDISVLDEAAKVAFTYGASSYQAGISLAKLVEFLNQSRIIPAPITWKNPVKKPKEIHRTDSVGKQRREDKMPPERTLEAMAEMFSNDLQGARDRFTTSIFALCMCAPSRISEVQDLPLMGRPPYYDWAKRFEHGYSQILDWIRVLEDTKKTDDFRAHFGSSNRFDVEFVLVIGRDEFLGADMLERLAWRSKNVLVAGHKIKCITYDQLLDEAEFQLDTYDPIPAPAKTAV